MVDSSIVSGFITALRNKFELKANKKDDISGDFSSDSDSFATVKAIKSFISSVIPTKTSDLTNDSGFLTSHNPVDSALSGTSTNAVQNKKVKEALDLKANASDIPDSTSDLTNDSGFITNADIPTKTSDLTNDSGFLTSHQSLASTVVTVDKQSTAESGYVATYVVKQNGAQVGSKINIPKDYLVKSASVKTVTAADTPVSGYVVGDKYIDFVINTKDGSGSDEHLYILVSDLVDTYTAGSGLTLSNNQFSISNGDITKAMLASAVQTSLGYADNYNSSVAKNITSSDISNWNAKGTSNITTGDVDSEIEAYLTAITNALNA